MPPLASIEIPVISRSRVGLERQPGKGKTSIRPAYKPRIYNDEPLPTKPSESAPKNAQIIGRVVGGSGVAYQLKIGDVQFNDVGVDEILDYVSALDLERYENREFEEEREVLKAYEAEREKLRQEKLDRMKERAKRKGTVLSQDDTGTNDESDAGEEATGRHGRARPTYSHLFKKTTGRGRPKKDIATSSSRQMSDEEVSEESFEEISAGQSSVLRSAEPLAELPKQRRRRRDKVTGELLPLPPVVQSTAIDKKRQRRRRHPLTGELMPVGWRYEPNEAEDSYEKRRTGRSSPSFRKLSISEVHHSKRQKLETDSEISRSASPLPTKAELFAQFEPDKGHHWKPHQILENIKNPAVKFPNFDDDSDVVEAARAKDSKLPPNPPPSKLGNNNMLISMRSSSAANSSSEPEVQTSILHITASKANNVYTSLATSLHGTPCHAQPAKTSVLNPSAGRASSTDPLTRPSDENEDSEFDLAEEEWYIEGILDHHLSDPRTHPPEFGDKPVMLYQVKWEGYEEPTW